MDRIAEMMRQVCGAQPRAIARAISLVEAGGPVKNEILAACRLAVRERQATGVEKALRIGVTGPAGAGKSSLVDQMIRVLRARNVTVGVVAVDPTSPYTGGALLGDRIRMQGFSGDRGVSIRSLATRGASGGIAASAEAACWIMEAAGREIVIVETVGVGQDDVAVAVLADVVVLVLAPGMGDGVQALKAGLMEAADVFVVNKADQAGTEKVVAEILGVQSLSSTAYHAPVLRTAAATGQGVPELLDVVRRTPRGRTRPSVTVSAPPRMDHLGIAVRDLSQARRFYEEIGLQAGDVEVVEHEGVRVLMMQTGESRIELLEGLGEQTTIGRFIAKRGEGLHHIALCLDDLDGMFAQLTADGVRLASEAVQVGAGGHRYFFVHPSSTGGVLVELIGKEVR